MSAHPAEGLRLVAALLLADGRWVQTCDLRALLSGPRRHRPRPSHLLAPLAAVGVPLEQGGRGRWRLVDLPPDDLLSAVLDAAHGISVPPPCWQPTRSPAPRPARVRRAYPVQRTEPDQHGRDRPVHTPALGTDCRCRSCNIRRSWTPARRAARAAMRRAQIAAGDQQLSGANLRGSRRWTAEEDALVRRLLGRVSLAEIARRLQAEHVQPRSVATLRWRIRQLGLSVSDARPLWAGEVARMLGTDGKVIAHWVARGVLHAEVWQQGPRGRWLTFSRADLEAFVRDQPAAYRIEKIRDRQLRALAEARQRAGRLLTTVEVCAAIGADAQSLRRWIAAGLVPSARRVDGGVLGASGAAAWIIATADLPRVAALWDAHQARRARRAVACPAGHPKTPENRTMRGNCRVCHRAGEQRAAVRQRALAAEPARERTA